MTPNHVGNYRLNELGQFEGVGAYVQRKADGTIDYILGDAENVRKVSEQLGLDPKKIQDVEPDRKDVFLSKTPSVNPLIEACMLKCILLTFDHLLQDTDDRFTRSPKIERCREIVRKFVQEGDQKEQRESMGEISLGLQYDPKYRGLYEKIISKAKLESHPFSHQLFVSADPTTKCLDAVFNVFGEDPHAFRLTNSWNGDCFTHVMTNGIFANQTASHCVTLAEAWGLGCPTLRKSFIISRTDIEKSQLENAADEISQRRFSIYRKAVEYRQMNCDENVINQITEAATRSWNCCSRIDLAIFHRMIVLFDGDNLDEDKTSKFLDVIIPILDTAGDDALVESESLPKQGWTYWLNVHRQCFGHLKQTVGEAGRIYVKKAWLEISDPMQLKS